MPTIKQQLTASKLMETNGSVSAAMKLAGYAETTTTNPQQITNSKGWKELMEEQIPDDLLAKKHRALLDKKDKEGEIDTNAVGKALDMAYKLKGHNAPEKSITVNIDTVSPEALELAKQILEQRRTSETISATSDGVISEPVVRETQDKE